MSAEIRISFLHRNLRVQKRKGKILLDEDDQDTETKDEKRSKEEEMACPGE
jgi:hypothetical protein